MHNNRLRNKNRQHNMPNRGSSYSNSNNYGRRETPEPEPQNSSPVRGVYSDQRTSMVMCAILGTQTVVKTRNGKSYTGTTFAFSEKGDIALQDSKLVDNDASDKPSDMVIPKDVFVVAKTNGVDMKGLTAAQDFTDSAIASRLNGNTEGTLKELQPWQDDDAVGNTVLTLEEESEGWDSNAMFRVNNEKFNVKSSYNEDMTEYTTRLPEPNSEGYEEREKLAKKHAEEIERSEAYQHRISKELCDGDEESKYSAVHRPGDNHPSHRPAHNNNDRKPSYSRMDSDQNPRNGNMTRNQGRNLRHNSPYSSSNQGQHGMHQSQKQMNNHYHQGPPPSQSNSMNRSQGPPPPMHQRQPPQQQQQGPNHSGVPSHPHPYHTQHPPMQPAHPPPSQQQPAPLPQRPPSTLQAQHGPKGPPPSVVPSNLSGQPPPSTQHPKAQPPLTQHPVSQGPPSHHPMSQGAPIQHPVVTPSSHAMAHAQGGPTQNLKHPPPNMNGVPPVQQNAMRKPMVHVNGEGQQMSEMSQKVSQMEVSSPSQTGPYSGNRSDNVAPSVSSPSNVVPPKASEPQGSQVDGDASQSGPTTAASPPAAHGPDRRRVEASSEDSRNKIGQQLHDFQRNFVLGGESQGTGAPEAAPNDIPQTGSAPAMSVSQQSSVPPASSSESSSASTTEATSTESAKAEKAEETTIVTVSKLNPNAKEFKPAAKPVAQAVPLEAQSPSPQQRVSPHYQQLPPYPNQYNFVAFSPNVNVLQGYQRKKTTVPVVPGGNDHLTAHQVTGQPLLATPGPMLFQTLPGTTGYPASNFNVISVGNQQTRMMVPSTLTMGQSVPVSMEQQNSSQGQPQPVFMSPGPQQSVIGPVPAHLTHHPQPAHHAQPLAPHPTSSQNQPNTPGGPHVPNPAPSPVLQQQHNPQQPSLQHAMAQPQGPPQSVTPQPGSHYPQMGTIPHSIQAVPRTSGMSQSMSQGGHPTVSIGYPINISAHQQYSYVSNAGATQYTYSAPQPQTSQNSGHGPGPQYVVMPQPGPQAHPSMQQPGQLYNPAGLQFQQHNLMQGPPQMPPGHVPNPNQGAQHIIHSAGMQGLPAGLHQQVSGTQPMFMQMAQQFQHQQ